MELLILVDEQDREIGVKDKFQVHIDGDLHRAFSVFIVDSEGRMLLQRRAANKYHSAGLWTNTCCSHPRPGETIGHAAERRLQEEMGIHCSDLQHAFHFTYKALLDNGLTEHEFDHVFIGYSDILPTPNFQEVSSYKYISPDEVSKDLEQNPGNYTAWFKLMFSRVKEALLAGKAAPTS